MHLFIFFYFCLFSGIRFQASIIQNSTLELLTTTNNFERLQRKMDDRLNYINDFCNSKVVGNFQNTFKMKTAHPSLFTVNGTGICTCKVPKASSTVFGKVLLLIQDQNKTEEIKRLSGYDIHGRMFSKYAEQCDPETEYTFFVTRNPYTRLFSAYIDKIFVPKFWRLALSLSYYANSIRLKENIRLTEFMEREIAKGDCFKDDISFEMFLKFVAASNNLDPHWTPASLLCDPCKQNYTAIVKQEEFKEETLFVLENFGVKSDIRAKIEPLLEEERVERSVQNIFDTVREIFRHVEKFHNCSTPLFVYLRIWQSMQILGYIDDAEPFRADIFLEGLEGAYERLKKHNIKFLNSTQRKIQREEYLKISYQSVSENILTRIKELFKLDFLMFEYDETPPR